MLLNGMISRFYLIFDAKSRAYSEVQHMQAVPSASPQATWRRVGMLLSRRQRNASQPAGWGTRLCSPYHVYSNFCCVYALIFITTYSSDQIEGSKYGSAVDLYLYPMRHTNRLDGRDIEAHTQNKTKKIGTTDDRLHVSNLHPFLLFLFHFFVHS